MPDPLSTYPLTIWLALLTTGLAIGLLAGFLGVGGGVIAVPVLIEVFPAIGIAIPQATPLALGTAQASILVASLTAVVAHWRAGTIDLGLVRAWLPALCAGAALGLAIGPLLPDRVLMGLFAAVAVALGTKMALGNRLTLARRQPSGAAALVAPGLVGALSASVAVGGGTLSTPVLSLFSFPIRNAIGAGALFNLVIALPATVTFLVLGWGAPGRPADAVGHIAVFCVAAMSFPALFVAPIAAHWSTRAPVVLMRRLFALCLAAIAVRLLLRL